MEKYSDTEIHFIIKLLRVYLQKVGCNKKYKNVLKNVIRLLCTLSNVSSNYFLYKHNFKTKGYASYTVSGVITQLQII